MADNSYEEIKKQLKESYKSKRTKDKKADTKKVEPKKATRAPGSKRFKPTNTKLGPNMGAVNKPKAKPVTKKKETGSMPAPRPRPESKVMYEEEALKIGPNMSKVNKPEKKKETMDRRAMGRALQRKAQASMGFKKGGSVKRNMRDGCAVRGKTKGKMC